MDKTEDAELKAISAVCQALESLEEGPRARVIDYVVSRFGQQRVLTIKHKTPHGTVSTPTAIWTLLNTEGPLRNCEIAQRLGLATNLVGATLDRMKRTGLVERIALGTHKAMEPTRKNISSIRLLAELNQGTEPSP